MKMKVFYIQTVTTPRGKGRVECEVNEWTMSDLKDIFERDELTNLMLGRVIYRKDKLGDSQEIVDLQAYFLRNAKDTEG